MSNESGEVHNCEWCTSIVLTDGRGHATDCPAPLVDELRSQLSASREAFAALTKGELPANIPAAMNEVAFNYWKVAAERDAAERRAEEWRGMAEKNGAALDATESNLAEAVALLKDCEYLFREQGYPVRVRSIAAFLAKLAAGEKP